MEMLKRFRHGSHDIARGAPPGPAPPCRAVHPKFLLDLTGSGSSLLRATYERLAPLSRGSIMVVTRIAALQQDAGQPDRSPGIARRRLQDQVLGRQLP
jgi:hypothetical protein